MKVLNFTEDEQWKIWTIVALVMHLGNVVFGGEEEREREREREREGGMKREGQKGMLRVMITTVMSIPFSPPLPPSSSPFLLSLSSPPLPLSFPLLPLSSPLLPLSSPLLPLSSLLKCTHTHTHTQR